MLSWLKRFGPVSGITLGLLIVVMSVNFATGWGPGGEYAPGGSNAPSNPNSTPASTSTTDSSGATGTTDSNGTTINGSDLINQDGSNAVTSNGAQTTGGQDLPAIGSDSSGNPIKPDADGNISVGGTDAGGVSITPPDGQ
ncbi:MAG: hypothetical protein LBQ41_00855 [Candidatus Ancillula sp.]|jgi:hypothetical protein|nr:hypothetical protein [Candidatus Ancillula sp.]